jgi:hypothetical protein
MVARMRRVLLACVLLSATVMVGNAQAYKRHCRPPKPFSRWHVSSVNTVNVSCHYTRKFITEDFWPHRNSCFGHTCTVGAYRCRFLRINSNGVLVTNGERCTRPGNHVMRWVNSP